VLRALYESNRDDLRVVAINDLGSVEANAHLLKWDSNHGPFPGEIIVKNDTIDLGKGPIKVTSERDPAQLPHKALNVDIVLECTGIFTNREKAALHLEAGAKRVVISAPANGADITVVYGVNHDKITSEHTVISNASCTTNCLAPVAFVLNNAIGIESGYMTTIHAFTSDQPTLDTYHGDLHRARSAATSMIPTSTGAAKAVGLVMPELLGKLDGTAIRVPTSNVSLIDFKFIPKRKTTVTEINEAIISASEEGSLKGVLGTNNEPLVSVDFNHNPHSSTFDLSQTQVIDGGLVRVLSWYDNEWGFSNRMSDTAAIVANTL
jgi:glyceraldehyde 3-phosphate dehydrogenase